MQETWIALLKGVDTFEGRCSLRTWLFSVLINIAKTRGDGCENYLQQFRQTISTVGKIGNDELDPALRRRLLQTFKNFR